MCALEAADTTRRTPIPVPRRNQAGSATICRVPHIRSRLLARARRRYGADQHHQPRHTACATLLLLRVPSAAAASVCCVLSVRCGGCSLGPLSVDRVCDCVTASLGERVSARTTKECMYACAILCIKVPHSRCYYQRPKSPPLAAPAACSSRAADDSEKKRHAASCGRTASATASR